MLPIIVRVNNNKKDAVLYLSVGGRLICL